MEEEFESMEMDMEEATAIEDVAEEDYSDPLTGQIIHHGVVLCALLQRLWTRLKLSGLRLT